MHGSDDSSDSDVCDFAPHPHAVQADTAMTTPTPPDMPASLTVLRHLAPMTRILEFRKLPQMKQKTPTWFAERRRVLTASSIADVLRPGSARSRVIIEKVTGVSSFKGNAATSFGELFEPVAREVYQYLCPEYVEEFGLIVNPRYPYFGASPDGVTASNRLLEIKCVSTRTITGVIPPRYYHQVQLQLHVCDCADCDFMECKFAEISREERDALYARFRNGPTGPAKGSTADDPFLCLCDVRPDAVTLYMRGDPASVPNVAATVGMRLPQLRTTTSRRAVEIPAIRTKDWVGKHFTLQVLSLQTIERHEGWMATNGAGLNEAAQLLARCLDDSEFFTKYRAENSSDLVNG